MFGPKVKIPGALYARARERADAAGYSSVDEFVIHLLERAVKDTADAATEEEIRERLKGLGYI